MRVRRSALALAAIAAFATFAPATADTTCPSDSRDNNPPQPFSGLAASSDPPTMVASSGISADVIAPLNEGHQVTINFTGGASPTYAFVVERGRRRHRVRVHGNIVSVHAWERSHRDVAFQQ